MTSRGSKLEFASFLLDKVEPFLDGVKRAHVSQQQLAEAINNTKLSETKATLDIVYGEVPSERDRLRKFVEYNDSQTNVHVQTLQLAKGELEQAREDLLDVKTQLRGELATISDLNVAVTALENPGPDLGSDVEALRVSTYHALLEAKDASGTVAWMSSALSKANLWLKNKTRQWQDVDTQFWIDAMNELLSTETRFTKILGPFRSTKLRPVPLHHLATIKNLDNLEQLFVLAVARAVYARRKTGVIASSAPLQEIPCNALRGLYRVLERFAKMEPATQEEIPMMKIAQYAAAILSVEYLVEWQTRESQVVTASVQREVLSSDEFSAIMLDKNWHQLVFGDRHPELRDVVQDAYDEDFSHHL